MPSLLANVDFTLEVNSTSFEFCVLSHRSTPLMISFLPLQIMPLPYMEVPMAREQGPNLPSVA